MDYSHSSGLALLFLGMGTLMAVAFVILMIMVFRKPSKTLPPGGIDTGADAPETGDRDR